MSVIPMREAAVRSREELALAGRRLPVGYANLRRELLAAPRRGRAVGTPSGE